jgi:hypothetical protein
VSGAVDEWSDELEKGEINEGESSEGRSVGVCEDVEEELERKTGPVRRSL